MYGGVDKYSGDIAFGRNKKEVDPLEVMKESNCFEVIVAEDTAGKEVFLGASLDISSGELTWNQIDKKDKTLKNVMGMSQMASMLKDKQRNEVYNGAITKCIQDFIAKHHRKPYVLDIGCGTGLLSMQAARAGAAKVYGCEMFGSWCEVARANVKENGLDTIVTIINKHSSTLTVQSKDHPHDYDLERKCDILVSEILDTALLGEGVLVAVRDAKKRLLVDHPIILPEKADVFVEMVQSPELKHLTAIEGAKINSISMQIEEKTAPCKYTTLLPIHYEFLRQNTSSVTIHSCSCVERLTTVDLTDGMNRRFVSKPIACSSPPNGLIFSWKVYLYEGQFTYSTTASDWNASNWQDHWMQGYYALPELSFTQDTSAVTLYSLMSDTNWRFDVSLNPNDSLLKGELIKPLQCTCGFHNLLSPGLLGQYSDPWRNEKLKKMINGIVDQYAKQQLQGPILVLGDDSFIGAQLVASLQQTLNKPTVYSFENKEVSLLLWKRIIEWNRNDTVLVATPCNNPDIRSVFRPNEIAAVFWNFHHYQMEDHCIMEALSYWCMVNAVRDYCISTVRLYPSFVNIMAMAIELGPLYDSFGEVTTVDGFKHSAFNANMSEWATNLYPFPLYMYQYKELSQPQAVFTIDFSQSLYCAGVEVTLPIREQGKANCVVFWCEYYCGDKEQFEDVDVNWQTPYRNGHFVPYKKQLLQFRKVPLDVKSGDPVSLRIDLDDHFDFRVSFMN